LNSRLASASILEPVVPRSRRIAVNEKNGETDRKEGRKNEIIAQEWTTLSTLWEGCKAALAPDDKIRTEIDALFPTGPKWSSEPEDWYKLNLAEQRVGAHLDETQLAVEYQNLLDLARRRKIEPLSTHEKNAALFSTPPSQGVPLERQRAVYLSLLHTLQSDFVETRFRRRLRSETATRLFCFGLCVMGLALLPIVIYLAAFWWTGGGRLLTPDDDARGHRLFSSEPIFGLMMVAGFGVLGAYFSRVMSFQSKLSTLGFDDVMNLYLPRMLLIRLLYGMIGAIIFYFVLRGRLLGGSFFPDLSQISMGEQVVWKAGADGIAIVKEGSRLAPSGLTILAPTPDLAKLLVWSFVAGFSERLVPDTLERTEAQAQKSSS
jgi:hypothetical protein